MGTRQMALNIVNMMSDEQLTSFVNLFSSIVPGIPNEETEAAMEEAEALLNDPHAKTFSSVDELFAELRS
jgi:hypothetical protein